MGVGNPLSSPLYIERCDTGAFRQTTVPADIALAVQQLELGDSDVERRQLELGLRTALTHDSYLFEHRDEAPYVTPGVLKALETLGSSWLSRELVVSLYQRQHYDRPGRLSDAVALGRTLFGSWAAALGWVARAARFGRSLSVENLPEGVTRRVTLQLLGLLCLLGEDESASRFTAAFLSHAVETEDSRTPEPMTTLLTELNRAGVSATWTYRTRGADHEQIFEAWVAENMGRSAGGTGRSKKAARAAAALEFLRQYCPQTLRREAIEPFHRPTGMPRTVTERHRTIVEGLAARFEIDDANIPFLSQSFIHSSWAYENATEMQRRRQQDNQVLGLVGNHVLHYEHVFVAVREAVASSPDTFALQAMLNTTYAKALLEADLGAALLLGAGQRQSIQIELAANAFQAAMGAVFLARGRPRSLLERWPADWEGVAELIAPAQIRPKDPSTLLQELATAAQLSWDYSFSAQGPDHNRQYTAVLTVDSSHLQRRITVEGQPAQGQTQAKHDVSHRFVAYAERLADPAAINGLASSALDGPDDRSISTFLLAHLVVVASAAPNKARLWRSRHLLGAHLAGQPQELVRWSRAVDQLLRRQTLVTPDVQGLTEFFRVALTGDATVQECLRAELAHSLDWVSQLEGPHQIDDLEITRLVHLAGAYRAVGQEQTGGSLRELLSDLAVLYRGRLIVTKEMPDLMLTSTELSVVEALAKDLTAGGEPILAQVDQEDTLVFTPIPLPDEHVQFLVRVWGELSHRLRMQMLPDAVAVQLPTSVNGRRGPVQVAVEQALQPAAAPLSAAIANLLHDLKNQVVAARQAARTTGGGRTSQLERRAAASRHLDQASSLGQRVRAATSLLATPGEQTTEFGNFLRRYSAAALLRLPANVALVPPSSRDEVTVGVDEPSLLSLLDNLVKNAVEAMPRGGTITLEWIHDDRVAMLEVSDDGPGLPEHVAKALANRQRIESSKPGGNGLGLLGVQAMLRRVGGDLELLPTHGGTRWNLTIPLAQPSGDGEADGSGPT